MIDKILTASTGNITKEDSRRLEETSENIAAKHSYGFFIFTENSFDKDLYSKAFLNIIALAIGLRCAYICFDRDAPKIPGLPTFDW